MEWKEGGRLSGRGYPRVHALFGLEFCPVAKRGFDYLMTTLVRVRPPLFRDVRGAHPPDIPFYSIRIVLLPRHNPLVEKLTGRKNS
ncbi:Hypothetical protein CINCED_3A006278 [Cinara cedri]|uniref:Uncharacterized protein n=1 Tax=Cinara cedri TaxID=506608 RepID=A0A5E4N1C8_9HEMI|nr:Hypothetical protein CINCED_3A006278 [Cinara cedri]